MNLKPYLGKTVRITVDRPQGSRHPIWNFVYPINYGHVPGTKAPDGEPIDAYILDQTKPIKHHMGTCIAIIHRKNDDDDKLVIADKTYTDKQILQSVNFQEQYFDSVVLR